MRIWIALGLCAGCSFEHGTALSGDDVDAGTVDGKMIDAPPPGVFPTGPFGTPERLAISGASYRDDDITLTGDMLEIFFESDRMTEGNGDIYVSRRASVHDNWSLPARVDELSTQYLETSMDVSTDGLTMYFSSNRPPSTSVDVYITKRPDRSSAWSMPVLVSSLSGSSGDWNAQPWSDTVLYLGSDRMPARGGSDIFRATRASADATWGTPGVIGGLDTNRYEGEAFADATGAIWFTGDAAGDDDIWRAEPNGDGTYKTPKLVMEVDTQYGENDPWLSPDGHTLFFTSTRDGSLDIYVATR